MRSLNYTTAIGSLKILSDQAHVDCARSLGCTEEDWELLTQRIPWEGKNRRVVKNLIEQLLYGSLQSMALPQIDVPAEYAAACIAFFVSPVNYFPACSWIANFHRADELGNFDNSQSQPINGLERVTSRQLFALVCQIISGKEIHSIAKTFKYKTGMTIGSLETEEGDTNEKKPKK